jgi:tRNA 2-thiouridine synthesizing protein A
MTDLSNVQAAKSVDARAMACPGPLLEAKKAIGSILVGQILEIMSGDHGSREDLAAWCKKTGNEFMGFVERDGYDSIYVTRKK